MTGEARVEGLGRDIVRVVARRHAGHVALEVAVVEQVAQRRARRRRRREAKVDLTALGVLRAKSLGGATHGAEALDTRGLAALQVGGRTALDLPGTRAPTKVHGTARSLTGLDLGAGRFGVAPERGIELRRGRTTGRERRGARVHTRTLALTIRQSPAELLHEAVLLAPTVRGGGGRKAAVERAVVAGGGHVLEQAVDGAVGQVREDGRSGLGARLDGEDRAVRVRGAQRLDGRVADDRADRGRAAAAEIAFQLFVGGALRRSRAGVGEPTVIVAAHRIDDAATVASTPQGEVRVTFSSPFDDAMCEAWRWPLGPADDIGAISTAITGLLAECRVDHVVLVPEVQPDRHPARPHERLLLTHAHLEAGDGGSAQVPASNH